MRRVLCSISIAVAIPAVSSAQVASPPGITPPSRTAPASTGPQKVEADRPADAPIVAAPPAPAVPPEPAGLARLSHIDPAAHRAHVMGTAVTVPRGSVVFELQSVHRDVDDPTGSLGAYLGVTDRLQASVTTMWADDDHVGFALDATLRVIHRSRIAVALTGGVVTVESTSADGARAGVVASGCVDGDRCQILLSGHATALLYDDGDYDQTLIPIIGGASLLAGWVRFKLLGEVAIHGDSSHRVVVGYTGLRLVLPRVAIDAALVHGGAPTMPWEQLPWAVVGLTARL